MSRLWAGCRVPPVPRFWGPGIALRSDGSLYVGKRWLFWWPGAPRPAFGTWDPTTSTPPSTPHPNCATCRSRRSHHREISSSTAPVPEGQHENSPAPVPEGQHENSPAPVPEGRHENSPGQPRAKPGAALGNPPQRIMPSRRASPNGKWPAHKPAATFKRRRTGRVPGAHVPLLGGGILRPPPSRSHRIGEQAAASGAAVPSVLTERVGGT
jgi:hypothetical protein